MLTDKFSIFLNSNLRASIYLRQKNSWVLDNKFASKNSHNQV